jgi:hypothetical protein
MSEYQYYEFCSLHSPLSIEARKEMSSLSSRAQVTIHGASYVYNYGDFRGNPKELLLKYFDVFFYISNFGTVRLMFKYLDQEVNVSQIKNYSIKHVLSYEKHGQHILLDININNEGGFGWTEGEGMLSDFLPLYEEIKTKDYQFLRLVSAINDELAERGNNSLEILLADIQLSPAQKALLNSVGI